MHPDQAPDEPLPDEPQIGAEHPRDVVGDVVVAPGSPFAGHRFGLESPVGSRAVRGPTSFVLAVAAGLALAAIIRVLVNA